MLDLQKNAKPKRANEDQETIRGEEDPLKIPINKQVIHKDQQNEELQTQFLNHLSLQPIPLEPHPHLTHLPPNNWFIKLKY